MIQQVKNVSKFKKTAKTTFNGLLSSERGRKLPHSIFYTNISNCAILLQINKGYRCEIIVVRPLLSPQARLCALDVAWFAKVGGRRGGV